MNEDDYWPRLEYRVCAELAGMEEKRLKYLWCDGFIPTQFELAESPTRITGRAWICNGRKQDDWKFTLFLAAPVQSREDIPWDSLLPQADATAWLEIDPDGRWIRIHPSRAVPA